MLALQRRAPFSCVSTGIPVRPYEIDSTGVATELIHQLGDHVTSQGWAMLRYGSGTGLDTVLVHLHGIIVQRAEPVAQTFDDVGSPAEMLAFVRNTFNLNVKQAAAVFNVERPTIYLWATQNDFVRVRLQNRQRMTALYCLAKDFAARGRLPGNALEAMLENSPPLFELLCAPDLDAARVLACHGRLQAITGRLKQAQSDKAMEMSNAIARGLASLGEQQD